MIKEYHFKNTKGVKYVLQRHLIDNDYKYNIDCDALSENYAYRVIRAGKPDAPYHLDGAAFTQWSIDLYGKRRTNINQLVEFVTGAPAEPLTTKASKPSNKAIKERTNGDGGVYMVVGFTSQISDGFIIESGGLLIDSALYIGESTDFERRFQNHRAEFRTGQKHSNWYYAIDRDDVSKLNFTKLLSLPLLDGFNNRDMERIRRASETYFIHRYDKARFSDDGYRDQSEIHHKGKVQVRYDFHDLNRDRWSIRKGNASTVVMLLQRYRDALPEDSKTAIELADIIDFWIDVDFKQGDSYCCKFCNQIKPSK
ncbi:hypothetical protein [Vibrio paucivorans]|uniref:GIY-YIG domain-containing protein n=1 Tax=Vibrio paucivorans TaxID=2829489 RepID=A0A9X3CIR2_9VIBR|nr:hypothetical protein [Vibrio paucivorans]MCW8336589.1 hypothetical protein [Vibrio paucivorans]